MILLVNKPMQLSGVVDNDSRRRNAAQSQGNGLVQLNISVNFQYQEAEM
jgi:hypothetical protein